VSTRKPWPEREDFFIWFDRARDESEFKTDTEVARAAGLDPSSISSWRSGRQRPTTASLSAVAKVLKKAVQEAWAKAGMLAPADMAHAPSEDPHIQIIRASKLPKAAKDMLVAQRMEEIRQAEAKLRQTIALLEGAQTT
jgi:transcriptional regulator with XRE-family HTH domain